MAIQHPSSLVGEIHFHVPHKVTSDFSPSGRCFLPHLQQLKCHSNIVHFLLEHVSPHCISVLDIKLIHMLNTPQNLNPILVSFLHHSTLHCSKDDISVALSVWNPPCEGWLSIDALAFANSAVSMGCDSFILLRLIQLSDPSFRCTNSFHPLVDLHKHF